MSKVLPATCVEGVVTADGVVLPDVEILSEGVGESEGIAIIDEDRSYYVAKTSPDLAATLAAVIEALTQTKTALDKTAAVLTALDGAGFLVAADAGVPSAPTNTADITSLDTAASAIESAKEDLEELSEVLI